MILGYTRAEVTESHIVQTGLFARWMQARRGAGPWTRFRKRGRQRLLYKLVDASSGGSFIRKAFEQFQRLQESIAIEFLPEREREEPRPGRATHLTLKPALQRPEGRWNQASSPTRMDDVQRQHVYRHVRSLNEVC